MLQDKVYRLCLLLGLGFGLWTPSQNSGGGKRRKVQFSKLQEVNDIDLDRGLGQNHISMRTTYRTTSMPDHVTAASSSYGNMAIW